MSYHLAIVGATGAVGKEMLTLLEKRGFPLKELTLFASPKSAGKTLSFKGADISIKALHEGCFKGIDIALFSAGKKASLEYVPQAVKEGAIVIDNGSAFRLMENVPLIIPEINAHALKNHQGIIASPNCTTTVMLIALAPLHKPYTIKRIVASTYQAASGAGALAMKELEEETAAVLNNKPYERTVFTHPYAFNLFTHNSTLTENGYVEEELKMVFETHKILEDPSIKVTATCVRVPVLRAHSISLNVEFEKPITKENAYSLLKNAAGLKILEDPSMNRFPMPLDATGQDDILVGRIRQDISQANTLEFWAVGDQLLKGAALNTIQIAELLCAQRVT